MPVQAQISANRDRAA